MSGYSVEKQNSALKNGTSSRKMGRVAAADQIFCPNLTLAEGQVFGVGCKIFTIAGPVILYGILASWVLGVIYWIGGVMGVI